MKTFFTISLFWISVFCWAQKVTLNPTITPAVFAYNEQITVTYNVTGTPLASLTNAWIWVWIPGKNTNAKYNINPATAAADPAKFTKSVSSGVTTWSITFKPSDFFTGDISAESQMGILLKANDWPNGQTTDYIANFGYKIRLDAPTVQPLAVQPSQTINVQASAPVASNFQLFVNDVLTDTKNNIQNYTYSYVVPASPGSATIKISGVAVSGGPASEVSFEYIILSNSPVVSRPAGIIAGINYGSDATKVTLCLWAPGKLSAYAFGDFSDWKVLPENLMNRDGDYFWIELSNLISGQEYGFQYWVGGSLKIAEPFADKILDPEDQYISSATYLNLKPYPAKALSPEWYSNRVSVFQTNQQPYVWQSTNYERPKKESLVIYELLLRDFFGSGKRNYQTLIDTLSYFKKLGINAIELMPVMEYNGNESWGYNPTFMFAPDKYYGTKNKFKEFVDKCHQNGIAVILDIAMNHHDIPNPFVMLDFDFNTFKPTANNKWFNVNATHPFNVFFDMNHESPYTKAYLDTVNHYWINEYKIDGYRFDLSKGFTQTNNPNNVGAWSNYDQSRINILKRMADKIWSYSPSAYVILEHLGVNSEEKELAEYRANEGKGMMLWGKMTDQYNQNTMGFGTNAEINGVYHGSRSWTVPNLVGYMESHDEERLMYKNLQFGNALGDYNVKNLNTALERMKTAATIFYTIPGPKMLWQFGELGFDLSINRCVNGTISDNCRLDIKPTVWEYRNDQNRVSLFNHTAAMIKLKRDYNVFQNGTATFATNNLVRQVVIRNKTFTSAPVDSSQMSAVVVTSFELASKDVTVSFPHDGTWYEYFSRQSVTVSSGSSMVTIPAGGFRLYTNVRISSPLITAIEDEIGVEKIVIYPNPVTDYLESVESFSSLSLISVSGMNIDINRIAPNVWDVRHVTPGFYIGVANRNGKIVRFKIIKQ